MANFHLVKSEVFRGGAKELRDTIEAMRSIEATLVERTFDEKWGLELKQKVLAGNAVAFNWAVADMKNGNGSTRMRVNGQHSSWALGQLLDEKLLPSSLVIHFDTYEADGENGITMLFRQFDARKSTRTRQDICGAYQGFQPALRECDTNILAAVVRGVAWYRHEVQKAPVPSGDDLYTLVSEPRLHSFFVAANELFKTRKAGELKKTPVLASLYGTFLDDSKSATIFWKNVAMGTLRSGHDAALDLAKEIETWSNGSKGINQRDQYAKCAKAWFAHQSNEQVINFRVDTKKKDLPVLGDLAA